MAESTLSPTQAKISRDIAFYLGWGRKADASEGLSSGQAANVVAVQTAGEARFAGAHDWGFLKPRMTFVLWPSVAVSASVTVAQSAGTTLTAMGGTPFYPSMIGHSIVITSEGTYTITGYTSSTVITVDTSDTYSGRTFSIAADGIYRLPDDFGGMESTQIEFARGSGHYDLIDLVAEPLIVRSWQVNDRTGRPQRAAVRLLTNDGTGQRSDLVTEPIPDALYSVSFKYNSVPNLMTSAHYVDGGALYADAVLKCCLAAAEEMFNENQSAMAVQEQKALAKAIRFDLRYNRPRRLGKTTTSNFRDYEEAMDSRPTGFVYRGTTYDVEV
jgi:hypothetical protein